MNAHYRTLLSATVLILFAVNARSDIIIYDVTQHAADTLKSLGTKFLLGCFAIAAAIVLAAVIKRKK
jgi:hypothetical protein